MKGIESKTLLGILLIVGGLFFLMQSLGLLMLNDLWPIIFAAAGAVFLYNFVRQRQNWWAVIPGMALLGIGTLIAFDQIFPRANDAWGGAIFLGSLSAAFLAVYLRTAGHEWWAIIPGGVLGTLTITILLEPLLGGGFSGGLFMLGLGATFALVYLLPTPAGRMRWAIYPAGILGGIGVLTSIAATQVIRVLGPLALIGLGLYLILRRRDKGE
ncbi:MAG: hypothetical protein JXA21_21630 [Anaerolineae bacterium]|nr:hypothetical protein [Anaerolineae bacterium]